MQKQTLKLQKQLALSFAVLALCVVPNPTNASWNFIIKAVLAYNFFGIKKPKITGLILPTFSDKLITGCAEVGEIETEPENFGRALDLSIGFIGLYKMNDTFGVGGLVDLGLSFSKEQQKSWKSLTISESFVGKLGIAMSFTDWVVVAAGVRMSYLTLSIDSFSDDDKKALNDANKGLPAAKAAAVNLTPGFKADKFDKDATYYSIDPSKSYSDSTWAWGLFADAYLLIPVTDNFKFLIKAGISGDMFAPEFKSLLTKDNAKYKIKGSATPTIEHDGDCKDLSVKIEGRMKLDLGLGVAFVF